MYSVVIKLIYRDQYKLDKFIYNKINRLLIYILELASFSSCFYVLPLLSSEFMMSAELSGHACQSIFMCLELKQVVDSLLVWYGQLKVNL